VTDANITVTLQFWVAREICLRNAVYIGGLTFCWPPLTAFNQKCYFGKSKQNCAQSEDVEAHDESTLTGTNSLHVISKIAVDFISFYA